MKLYDGVRIKINLCPFAAMRKSEFRAMIKHYFCLKEPFKKLKKSYKTIMETAP